MAKKLLVSVISDLTTDQRLQRICTTLQEMGFEVEVIAREFTDSLPLGIYAFKARRLKCYFRQGIMQYAEFNFKLFCSLLFTKKDILLANDLDTLAPNFLISKMQGKPLVYDTHEYFTGVAELRNSPTKRKIWKTLEGFILPKLKTIYTVNKSVKDKYESEYPIHLGIVRNVPITKNSEPIEVPEAWRGKKILIMQGTGIHEGRGGIELLEAMKYLDDSYFLVFIGSGTHWNYIAQKRKEWNLENKVVMLDRMAPDKLRSYTALAHIGLTLDKKDDLNYLLNLSNKLFDYIHAGVPIVATAIPEVVNILTQFPCGVIINDAEPKAIAAAVTQMLADTNAYNEYKTQCALAAKELCWENEKLKLEEIYRPYLQ